ncbi:MAG: acyl-CoA desaturase [Spirulina sp. SIO3F2]|nr:acyl-CoA desaturase [Spirulina sp. SIO3F2]
MTDSFRMAKSRIEWEKAITYILLHISCLAVLWVGISMTAVAVAIMLYIARMFFITGLYHRYFSHRAFKTSRVTQFIFGVLGCTAGQLGPVWWSSHHRHHHRYSDQPEDIHSPHHDTLLESHAAWFLRAENAEVQWRYVKDWSRYPELVWLEEQRLMPFFALAGLLFALGQYLNWAYPQTHTDGWQLLVWGFAISTVAVYHATYTINTFAHLWGTRRFETDDHSRNNWFLAILTMGEGWHNNHHWYPSSASQGLKWWELDITFYILKGLESLGIIWDLRTYPAVPATKKTEIVSKA